MYLWNAWNPGSFACMDTHRHLPRIAVAGVGLACLLPQTAPAAALGAGIALKALFGARTPNLPASLDRHLLQGSVILLGFGMDIHAVLQAGLHGMGLSLSLLAATFGLGWLFARLLKLDLPTSILVSAGTAICGGSAIAAVGASTHAKREAIGMSLGVVFLLNAVALVVFPLIGHRLALTPGTFGTWAGLAIHDVSSVVGAATTFDANSLPSAVATKMGRTLWIIPVSLLAAWAAHKNAPECRTRANVPFFLVGFLAAAFIGALVPEIGTVVPHLRMIAHAGFGLALALIGTRVDLDKIRQTGAGLLVQGLVQWIVVAGVSLVAIR